MVKFTRVGVAFVPPRSSLGKYVRDGEICCRPPKFSQEGEYEVSLSLNGSNFVRETLRVTIYPEPALLTISPLVSDARTILSQRRGVLDISMVSGCEWVGVSGCEMSEWEFAWLCEYLYVSVTEYTI